MRDATENKPPFREGPERGQGGRSLPRSSAPHQTRLCKQEDGLEAARLGRLPGPRFTREALEEGSIVYTFLLLIYVYLDPGLSMMNVRNRGLFCSTINSEMLFRSLGRKEDFFFFTVYLQPNTHRSLIVVENSAFLITLIAKIAALVLGEVNCSETLALIHSFGASQWCI